ncbi:MAG: NrfD/PsrC family molybdoenzyme membrane anchor subunit [Candidatus Odinarchaeota archaeon]
MLKDEKISDYATMTPQERKAIEDNILSPIFNWGWKFYLMAFVLLIVIGIAAVGWIDQLRLGLVVTGLNERVFWGIYISNFIFFIGISYSGTLISAVLRLTGAEWRKPLTRMAELITVIGILVGFSMIIIDIGRLDRIYLLPLAFRFQSPLFWDFLSVSTYIVGSLIFLYVPLVPDIAIVRDRFNEMPVPTRGFRKMTFNTRKYLYRLLAVGWKGNREQRRSLEKTVSIMSIILIPVAVSCHTVIAFIFAMTWRVGWHSTIFGPYFVVAAVFSGTAAIIVAMGIIRKLYKFERLLSYKEFRNLGLLLFALLGTYFYFTITEYFTTAYRGVSEDVELLEALFFGNFALLFWFFMIFGMIVPGIIIAVACLRYKSEKSIWAIVFASILVIVGMWVKRYIIVVPALSRPFVEQTWTPYTPSWVELAVTFAGVAGLVLAYGAFSKFFPLISIWELFEEDKELEIWETFEETKKTDKLKAKK